jgi:predicted RNA-binding protein with PUA-like domain
MAQWLLKTEPSEYAWDDLVRDKKASWDGVANPTAAKHLREMQKGELAIVYHTGGEKQAVGIAEVVAAGDPPSLKPKKKLAAPVTLAQLKAHPAFADSPLVKIGRLSVVPISAAQWRALLALAGTAL